MPINFKQIRGTAPQYAVIGKLPRRADFININAGHPVVQEFDSLLAKGLLLASQQPGWSAAGYLNANASDFLFTSSDGRWCFWGVVQPSRDESGRLYPIVGGAILPLAAVAPYTPELSIANELFLAGLRDQLISAVDNAVEMLACQQFFEIQLANNSHIDADFELSAKVLQNYLDSTATGQLKSDIDNAGQGSLVDILLAFLFHSELKRHYGLSGSRRAILLPLPRYAGEDTLGQAAWLALYQAAMRDRNGRFPDFLAFSQGPRRYLALAPEGFGERFLPALWAMAPDPASTLDVGDRNAPWKRQREHTEASYLLEQHLQDPGTSIESLCSVVGRIASNLERA
jgi:type VI secretion system protein ImpM